MSLPVKAVLQAVFMSAVGFVLFKWKGHVIGPSIVWTLAGLVLIGGLFAPPLFHAIEKGGKKIGLWFATALNYLLLTPFFFLVFTFGHLVLKVKGIDPMCRAFPTKETTYWIPRKPVTVEQYRKQH